MNRGRNLELMDFFSIIALLGGLALFLYGMNVMSDGLAKISGGKMEQILENLTSNPIKAVLLGAGVTAVIQSSSATTVMVVGFVNSGIMKLSQAVGEDVTDHRSAAAAAEKLRSLGAQNVLVSMAGDGAVLVCDEGVFSVKAPKGELKNSVGAGDSMVAGFIAGYIGTGNFENALRLACAAGSATAFSPGLAEKSLIDRLVKEL